MRIILLCVLCCSIAGYGYSQTCTQRLGQINLFMDRDQADSAFFVAKSAEAACRLENGEKDSTYLKVLSLLAYLYEVKDSLKTAESCFKKAIGLQKAAHGEKSSAYIISIVNLNDFYKRTGDSVRGAFILQTLPAMSAFFGKHTTYYANWLNELGSFYIERNDIVKAESTLKSVLQLIGQTEGMASSNYATVLNNLSVLYETCGRFKEQEVLLEKACKIHEKDPGLTSDLYATDLNNLAGLNVSVGRFHEADSLAEASLAIYAKLYGDSSVAYAKVLETKIRILHGISDYYPQLKVLQKLETIFVGKVNRESVAYAQMLILCGEVFKDIGNYEGSEYFYQLAIEKIQYRSGKNMDYALAIEKLANLYVEMGLHKQALQLLEEDLQIQLKITGSQSISCATALVSVANATQGIGNYSHAIELYKKAIAIFKQKWKDDTPSLLSILHNMAEAEKEAGDYQTAIQTEKMVLVRRRKLFGAQNLQEAHSLSLLSRLYFLEKKYDSAIYYEQLAIKIEKPLVDTDHPSYSGAKFNLGVMLQTAKGGKKGIKEMTEGGAQYNRYIYSSIGFLSEQELQAFIGENETQFMQMGSIAEKTKDDSLIQLSLDNTLLLKGLGLENIRRLRESIRLSEDTALRRMYEDYIHFRKLLVAEYQQPAVQSIYNRLLPEQVRQLEKELIKRSPAFQQQVKAAPLTWQDVQKHLADDEAAIELVRYRLWQGYWTDSSDYCALVIRNHGFPQLVRLCEQRLLYKRLQAGDKDEDSTYTAELYDILWRPLDGLMIGVHKIYYAASGLTYRLNFYAIPCPGGGVLGDKYDFHLLASTRDLVTHKPETFRGTSIVLYGGINYEPNESKQNQIVAQYRQLSTPGFPTKRSPSHSSFHYLPGTLAEVKSIKALTDSLHIDCKMLTGYEACEESVKYFSTLPRSPGILHFSTHGFFFPDTSQESRPNWELPFFMRSANSLSRCGLALAGANANLEGVSHARNLEDGILTGAEISNLSLQNTHLVVLSACETALGVISNEEGVFGLQRAFKMAGAGNILMSLWEVDDNATKVFMTLFYKHLIYDRLDIHTALQQTRQTMRANPHYRNPNYWAGFILLE